MPFFQTNDAQFTVIERFKHAATCTYSITYNHLLVRRHHHAPLFVHFHAVLSFWEFEVEILQQSDQEEKYFLTRQLLH